MGFRNQWDAHIPAVCEILGRHRAVADALPEIELCIGVPTTGDAVRKAFAARRLGPPSTHLRRELSEAADMRTHTAYAAAKSSTPESPRVYDTANTTAQTSTQGYETSAVVAESRRFVSGAGTTRVLVCPDAHHPFVDRLAWETFLAAGRALRPDVLVIIGDFIDSYSISSHTKDPARKVHFRDELDATNAALDEIDALRVPRVIMCEGNHETRLARAIADRAPEFHGLLDMRGLLDVNDRGYEWVPYKQWIRVGKIAFTHDIERCGVNAARQSLLDFGGNIVFGHTHRGAVVYQGTVDGDQHVCLNVGWLGDYETVDYKHQARARRDWQHGFGLVTLDSTGCGWCEFVPILSGRCIVDGRVISGRAAS